MSDEEVYSPEVKPEDAGALPAADPVETESPAERPPEPWKPIPEEPQPTEPYPVPENVPAHPSDMNQPNEGPPMPAPLKPGWDDPSRAS